MPTGDIYYSPKPSWPSELIAEIQPSQILIIGQPSRELVDLAITTGAELKHLEPDRPGLILQGSTFFRQLNKGDGWRLIFSLVGNQSRNAVNAERQQYLSDNDPLVYMCDSFPFQWGAAKYFGDSAKFEIGDSVQIITEGDNRVGKIEKIQFVSGSVRYGVLTNTGLVHLFEEALDRLVATPGDPLSWIQQKPSNADTIALTLTATKLREPLTEIIYSFQTSRTLFRPYQFKPVLKMLTGATQRLLIADEVGLGKTIEAGLIWSELEFRSPLENVLVVCPAVLKKKWQNEMLNRFDRKLVELNRERIEEWVVNLEKGRHDSLSGVATLESLRSSPFLDRLREVGPKLDLVIVDEAHYLRNSGNKSHQLGQDLSDWAEYMVFLSATPLNLKADDLFNLLSLLDSSQFFDKQIFEAQLEPNKYLNHVAKQLSIPGTDPRTLLPDVNRILMTELGSSMAMRSDFQKLHQLLENNELNPANIADAKRHIANLNTLASVFTRTRKKDSTEASAKREPIPIIVQWSAKELAFYNAIRKWFTIRAMANGHVPGFTLQMPLRQAASCLPAMLEYMKSKFDFKEDEEDPLDFMSENEFEDTQGLMDELIINLGVLPTFEVDTKYEAFETRLLEALQQVGKQALVFSFFTRTIDYLHGKLLAKGLRARVMYGSTPPEKRYEIMEHFRRGDFDVLICSEVGSEGLDFEFCNILVNYDLPWNPMRVEQRIGRLDRFGQKSEKIFIMNVQVPGTIEDDIFMRLYERIQLFEDSIGKLEPIIRDEMRDLTVTLLNPKLSQQQVDEEILRKSIAWELKQANLEDLSTHQNLIEGIDSFLIEGFEEHTPGRGRFIGAMEIQRVVQKYFAKYGGSINELRPSKYMLIGSDLISKNLRTLNLRKHSASRNGIANISRDLDGRNPGLLATFDAEVSANEGIELISVRHPLLEVIQKDLAESELLLSKFGTLRLPPKFKVRPSLVALHLARSSGIRPKLDLWPTSIDLETFAIDELAGHYLLQSLAEGSFENSDESFSGYDLRRASDQIEKYVARRHMEQRQILASDNQAIFSERLEAQKLSLQNKINLTKATVEKMRQVNRDPKTIAGYQSRIDRLTREFAVLIKDPRMIPAELELEATAYVLVSN